jgi:hypothetical protein
MEALLEALQGQPLAIVTFGAVLALIFGVRYLGLWQGLKSSPAASAGSAQVAAVIVDPTALNKAAGEVAGLAVAVTELVAAVKEASRNHKRTAEELDAIREELRIHREVARR